MITYIALFFGWLLSLLGIVLKPTTEYTGGRSKHFKKPTTSGWILLLLMAVSLSILFVDHFHKENENKIAQKLSQFKDSLNATKIQQLLEKAKNDSINAEIQKEYLLSLLSSAKKNDAAQTATIKKTDKYNNYLARQIEEQHIQSDRLLNPLEKLNLEYTLKIAASQKEMLLYKKRILAQDPCSKCDIIALSDEDWLPNQNTPDERAFAFFLMDIFATVSFKEYLINGFDGKAGFLMKSGASTSVEYLTNRDNDSSRSYRNDPKVSLLYSKKDDAIIIDVYDSNPFQRHTPDIISFKDFAGKETLFEIGIGVSLTPELSSEESNMVRSIDFEVLEVVLRTEKSGRILKIINFKPVYRDKTVRMYTSKLERNLLF
jgi:hypothetical protein